MRGIYLITFRNYTYIGSSKDLDKRRRSHLSNLKGNRHHNCIMQRLYNKYGMEDFNFSVLESDVEDLFDRERYWIAKLNPNMNIGGVGGGDNLTNHPNRDEIIARRSAEQRRRNALLSDEERKAKWGKHKEENHNWRGGTTFCSCGARISSSSATCHACRDRTGKNNPFYGRQHTEETKKKLSESRKGSIPANSRKVLCEGNLFDSLASAARHYGVTAGAMHYRVNNSAVKWREFYYINV